MDVLPISPVGELDLVLNWVFHQQSLIYPRRTPMQCYDHKSGLGI
jgi:hypothetical protein